MCCVALRVVTRTTRSPQSQIGKTAPLPAFLSITAGSSWPEARRELALPLPKLPRAPAPLSSSLRAGLSASRRPWNDYLMARAASRWILPTRGKCVRFLRASVRSTTSSTPPGNHCSCKAWLSLASTTRSALLKCAIGARSRPSNMPLRLFAPVAPSPSRAEWPRRARWLGDPVQYPGRNRITYPDIGRRACAAACRRRGTRCLAYCAVGQHERSGSSGSLRTYCREDACAARRGSK